MNNKLEVIGIDHGWSMMKTISQVFVTGVKEITTTPALFGDVLEYEGKFYKVGTVRQALDVTPEYLLIGDNNMTSYTEAIKRELKQLNDYGQISEIKETELNSTILSHLEMSNDLVDAVKTDWNAKGIFKRIEKEEDKQIVVDSYCTRPYVQDVILRYCQNRSIFKTKFAIIDGMLLE